MQNPRDFPVVDYLRHKGFVIKRRGNRWFTHSPYRRERTPSFCIFPDNAWVDFGCDGTSPRSGNVITLARFFGDDLNNLGISPVWVAPPAMVRKPWNGIPPKFLEVTDEEKGKIAEYAISRRLETLQTWYPSIFFTKTDTGFDSHPAIMFPHQQELGGMVTGAKFRAVEGLQRYSSSGVLGFYIMDERYGSEIYNLYVVEGEINANSLATYCKEQRIRAVVLSTGGVNNVPLKLPISGTRGKLLLDYDGNEQAYQGRVARYKHLDLDPVKLILPKGEDINSLYCENKLHLIDHLL